MSRILLAFRYRRLGGCVGEKKKRVLKLFASNVNLFRRRRQFSRETELFCKIKNSFSSFAVEDKRRLERDPLLWNRTEPSSVFFISGHCWVLGSQTSTFQQQFRSVVFDGGLIYLTKLVFHWVRVLSSKAFSMPGLVRQKWTLGQVRIWPFQKLPSCLSKNYFARTLFKV